MAMKRISEGAEADIYSLKFLGMSSIIKYRRPKPYLIHGIEESIRISRTKTEARLLAKASSIINAPKPILVSKYCIVMERINGKITSALKEIGKRNAGSAGLMMAKLHKSGIIHGDFTKANLMLTSKGLFVIDFGLSYSSNLYEDMAFDVLLFKRSVNETEFASFSKAYAKAFEASKQVMERLAEIEMRGRYQNRSLDVAH